jgi:hypothetical protein
MTLFGTSKTYYEVTFELERGKEKKTRTQKTFIGTIQPITGKELETLNVGRESLGKVKVYSSVALNVSTEDSDKSGDIVIYNNQEWELIADIPYQNSLIPHYKYIAEFRKVV